MDGLLYLIAAALYFWLMYAAVRWAWRKGHVGGGSRGRAIAFATAAFLAVYLPLFWGLIPTVLVHRHFCAKDAGFTAYVDAKQWHAKNFDKVAAVNVLPRAERERSQAVGATVDGFVRYATHGGLLLQDFKSERIDIPGLTVRRSSWRVADARVNEVIAMAVDYSTGNREDVRMWLHREGCTSRPPAAFGEPVRPVTSLDLFQEYGRKLIGENS